MKKLLIALITCIVISFVGNSVFSDEFVPSITVQEDVSIKSDPVIVHADECVDELVVTSYVKKDSIESDESQRLLDEAYDNITDAEKVSDLNEGILDIAHSLGADEQDLVVRDLFDITEYEVHVSDEHNIDEHTKTLNITLETETLENFVALLVYYDNEWHIVENTNVDLEQSLLSFSTEELSPFAIIVATDYTYVGVGHGCIWHLYIAITMIVTFVIAQIVRRRHAETHEKKKKNILFRDIIALISLILSIIFYIFGTCKYDVYALICDILIVATMFIYSHPHKHEK